MRTRPVCATLLAAFLPLLAAPAPCVADIGTVAAVNPDMSGTPPQSGRRTLVLGTDVVSDELIETSEAGSGQLLFRDHTTLTVSPNSRVVLDRYVYDPAQQTGDIALSVTRGALRFVGGRITKKSTAIIRTPTATIGLRGGALVLEVDEKTGEIRIIMVAGFFVSIQHYGDSDGDGLDDGPGGAGGPGGPPMMEGLVLARAGATAQVLGNGAIVYTGLVSAEDLGRMYATLEGNGSGGNSQPPSSSQVDSQVTSLGGTNSGAVGATQQQPVSTTGQAQPAGTDPATGITQDSPMQTYNTVGQKIGSGVINPITNLPDPTAVAALTGTATYQGPTFGVLASGSVPISEVSGSFAMTYDFGARAGAVDLMMLDNIFSVDVMADPTNPALYVGQDAIFGGPDSVTAAGVFFPGGSDPAATTSGDFLIDLQSQGQTVTGVFDAGRQ